VKHFTNAHYMIYCAAVVNVTLSEDFLVLRNWSWRGLHQQKFILLLISHAIRWQKWAPYLRLAGRGLRVVDKRYGGKWAWLAGLGVVIARQAALSVRLGATGRGCSSNVQSPIRAIRHGTFW